MIISGWAKRIFGKGDKNKNEHAARNPAPRSAMEINEIDAHRQEWSFPEERREAGDAYFSSMSQMQKAVASRQYEKAAGLARENLRTLPKWVEEEVYNASKIDQEPDEEGKALLPPSIPVLQQGGTIMALMGDEEGLSQMVELVNDIPELSKWASEVEKHVSSLELFRSIEKAIHDHPNCLQTDVKKLIGSEDGRRVANLISYLDKAKRIVRIKEGRTYRILPAVSKDLPSQAQQKPQVPHQPPEAVVSDSGIGGESFAAIDFETATGSRDSACALGVVVFKQGKPVTQHRFLIRPPGNEYDPFNTGIHGIGPEDTAKSPKFPAVWRQATEIIGDRLVIAHNTAFDISVARRTAERYNYVPKPFRFACTYRLARSADPQRGSWRLPDLAREFGIELSHHDPVSDAQAAGHLWLALAARAGKSHEQLLEQHRYRTGLLDLQAYKPFSNAVRSSSGTGPSLRPKDFFPQREPDPENPLFGKKIVFTGKLASMPRHEAFQCTVDAGARPVNSVSSKTDYLVLGEQNLKVVGKAGISSKHRKALELNKQGSRIDIIDEDLFFCFATDPQP